MKEQKGIILNGEWLGYNVLVNDVFNTICATLPAVMQEFLHLVNNIECLENAVVIDNFSYNNENLVDIAFSNDKVRGIASILFDSKSNNRNLIYSFFKIDSIENEDSSEETGQSTIYLCGSPDELEFMKISHSGTHENQDIVEEEIEPEVYTEEIQEEPAEEINEPEIDISEQEDTEIKEDLPEVEIKQEPVQENIKKPEAPPKPAAKPEPKKDVLKGRLLNSGQKENKSQENNNTLQNAINALNMAKKPPERKENETRQGSSERKENAIKQNSASREIHSLNPEGKSREERNMTERNAQGRRTNDFQEKQRQRQNMPYSERQAEMMAKAQAFDKNENKNAEAAMTKQEGLILLKEIKVLQEALKNLNLQGLSALEFTREMAQNGWGPGQGMGNGGGGYGNGGYGNGGGGGYGGGYNGANGGAQAGGAAAHGGYNSMKNPNAIPQKYNLSFKIIGTNKRVHADLRSDNFFVAGNKVYKWGEKLELDN